MTALRKSTFGGLPAPLFITLLVVVLLASACAVGRDSNVVRKSVPGGDAEQGREAIMRYGCGACHTIGGIPGAHAVVGPPLRDFDRRHIIAGVLPNTAGNLIVWIQNPQLIRPGSIMPDLGVTESDARNIAAYLYSRRN